MDAFNTWVRTRMGSRGYKTLLFDTSNFGTNHVEMLNGWQSFCNDTTVWQRTHYGHYYTIECDDPDTCRLARQAADERNARMNGDEKLGEHTDALAELMRYNNEMDLRKEEMEKLKEEADKNAEDLEIKNARKEAAQKGLTTKRRNKERRDEQKRLTEHICAELEALKGQDEQKNELLAGLQRDVLRVYVLGLDVRALKVVEENSQILDLIRYGLVRTVPRPTTLLPTSFLATAKSGKSPNTHSSSILIKFHQKSDNKRENTS